MRWFAHSPVNERDASGPVFCLYLLPTPSCPPAALPGLLFNSLSLLSRGLLAIPARFLRVLFPLVSSSCEPSVFHFPFALSSVTFSYSLLPLPRVGYRELNFTRPRCSSRLRILHYLVASQAPCSSFRIFLFVSSHLPSAAPLLEQRSLSSGGFRDAPRIYA
jgi:hypothetical protein